MLMALKVGYGMLLSSGWSDVDSLSRTTAVGLADLVERLRAWDRRVVSGQYVKDVHTSKAESQGHRRNTMDTLTPTLDAFVPLRGGGVVAFALDAAPAAAPPS